MQPRKNTNIYTSTPRATGPRPERRRPRPSPGPRPRSRKSRLSGGALSVIFLSLVAVVAVIILFSNNAGPNIEREPNGGYYTARTGSESQEPPHGYGYNNGGNNDLNINGTNGDPISNIPLVTMPIHEIADTGYLALINRQHAMRYEPYSGHITGAWPTVAVSRVDGMYLHESALRAVSEMFATARQEDIAAFFVSSGFRSYEAQTDLYGDGSNSAFVQPPGHSEHHTGLAADILAPGIGMMEMGNTPEGEWLAANSYRYGLILRYPQHATAITGIEFEPWHFRYVGRAHAYFMKHSNLVLEEYVAKIINYGHISFEKDGQTYHIMHKLPQDGMIYVPYELEFMVSSDNKGGFVIVAWNGVHDGL
ncbi:MAG: M15 family metallopeptidase [Defluviitaleaceae bacterium]|nr:M15 family metallopeptidase [Defluviitaleaceae bacterium]